MAQHCGELRPGDHIRAVADGSDPEADRETDACGSDAGLFDLARDGLGKGSAAGGWLPALGFHPASLRVFLPVFGGRNT